MGWCAVHSDPFRNVSQLAECAPSLRKGKGDMEVTAVILDNGRGDVVTYVQRGVPKGVADQQTCVTDPKPGPGN